MRKRVFGLLLMLLFFSFLVTGCKRNTAYKDGIYVGKSAKDDRGAYGETTITISGSEITDCEFETWQADGSRKDENYGKVIGENPSADYYEKAQTAVRAMAQYAEQLEEVKKLSDVDVISGATISYNQFVEAVEDALHQAKE